MLFLNRHYFVLVKVENKHNSGVDKLTFEQMFVLEK